MISENQELLRLFTWVFTDLMIRRFKLVSRAFELVTRRFELVDRGFELVTRTFEFQLVLLSFQLVTHNSQLVTRNSCFIVSRKNKEQFSSSRLYFMRIVFWLCNFLWRWNNLFVVSAFLELIYLFWAHASTPHMYSLDKNFWIFERYNVFCYLSVFFFFFNVRKKWLTYLLTYLLT